MRRLGTALGLLALVLLTGCGGTDRGQQLITHYGCGSCHQISGIEQADGRVGPSLENYKDTRYITGGLTATPTNTARWISHPQRYARNTVMPELGVTKNEARAMAAYLYGH